MFRKFISALLVGAILLTMAVPALAETLYGTVVTPTSDGAAYVRRVAGAGQPIVGSAKNGDQLIILKKGNTWHRVKVVRTGVSGWMYGDYIRFNTSTTDINQPGKVSSSAGYANFRTGAGTDSSIITRLDNGTKLNVISKTGSWYYVYHAASGNYGYISANLVSLTAADAGTTAATATVQSSDGFANLRKGPSTNYAIVAPLYNGTMVETVSVSGSWTRVNVPSTNQYGYVYTKLLTGETADDDWADAWGDTPDAYETGRIASSDGYANFRTGPSTDDSVIAKLYNNVLVSILETKGNWYKVQLSDAGRIGYVYKNLVEEVQAKDTATTTGNVNMRSGPGTDYTKKTVVAKGTPVSVLSYHGNFARVNANGWIGYVSTNYLK